MARQYCPECGHQNPVEARFCMDCGCRLDDTAALRAVERAAPVAAQGPIPTTAPAESGTDWAGLAAAGLAFLGLRRMSRKARQTAIVIGFLVLFFGCPMVCGFMMFLVESFTKLFQ